MMRIIKLRNISIKVKLIAYSILMISMTASIISLASYRASENIIKNQIGNQTKLSTMLVMKRTDELLRNIQNFALSIAYDKRTISFLSKSESEIKSYEDYESILNLSEFIRNFNSMYTYLEDMYIYNLREMFYISSRSTKVDITKDDIIYRYIMEDFPENDSKEGKYYSWHGNVRKNVYGNNSLISLIVPIRSSSFQLLGAMVVNVKESAITNIYNDNDLKMGYTFFVQESDGTIISTANKDLIGTKKNELDGIGGQNKSYIKMFDNQNCLITIQESLYNHWEYISVNPIDSMMADMVSTLQRSILLIGLIAILMLFILTILINNTFYVPIEHFIKNIKESIQAKKTIEKINRNDEIGFIFNSFSDIFNENSRLLTNIFDQKIHLKNTELRMLEAQINPHFLYNTLDGAICMNKIKMYDESEGILNALVKLYRATLDDRQEVITVRDEIENLKYYNTIQDIRYRGKITFDFAIQDEILNCKVIKLILQPLVENSIEHGMGKNKKRIHISIAGHAAENRIEFVVRDNGIGMPSCNLRELQGIIENTLINTAKFYALQNVNKRIILYYGEQYGLTINSIENEWTEVRITLPAVE